MVFSLKTWPSYSPKNVIGTEVRVKKRSMAAHVPLLNIRAG